eukprot:549318_1
MAASCTTDSVTPTWVTIGFIICELLILIATSIYSIKSLKQDSKGQSSTLAIQSDWESATAFGKFKIWVLDVISRKSIYVALITHLSDTATDFAAVVEFYQIAHTSSVDECNGLNVWYLFGLAIGCMITYRIISSITVFRITRSPLRVFLQFLDVELFQVLYVSHRLDLKHESSPQRLIKVLEAVFEAAPQSLIQIIYLIKTKAFSSVIFASTILSFVNVTMTIVGDDSEFLDVKFENPCKKNETYSAGKEIQCSCCCNEHAGIYKFTKYALLRVFRIADIPSQILLFVFIWLYVSGYVLTIIICLDVIISLICFLRTKSTDALMGIIAIPINFGGISFKKTLWGFWIYSMIRICVLNVLIYASNVSITADDTLSNPVILLLVFCSFGSVFKWFIGAVLYFVYGFDGYCSYNSRERSNINRLVDDEYFKDAIELIFFKNFNVASNCEIAYGGEDLDSVSSLLAIACRCDNDKLFQLILNYGIDDEFGGKYTTGLIAATYQGKVEYVKRIFNSPDINMKYVIKCEKSVREETALYYAVERKFGNGDSETLTTLLKCVNKLLKNDPDAENKKSKFLQQCTIEQTVWNMCSEQGDFELEKEIKSIMAQP